MEQNFEFTPNWDNDGVLDYKNAKTLKRYRELKDEQTNPKRVAVRSFTLARSRPYTRCFRLPRSVAVLKPCGLPTSTRRTQRRLVPVSYQSTNYTVNRGKISNFAGMERIRLTRSEKEVLRLLGGGLGCHDDYPRYVFPACAASLELQGACPVRVGVRSQVCWRPHNSIRQGISRAQPAPAQPC